MRRVNPLMQSQTEKSIVSVVIYFLPMVHTLQNQTQKEKLIQSSWVSNSINTKVYITQLKQTHKQPNQTNTKPSVLTTAQRVSLLTLACLSAFFITPTVPGVQCSNLYTCSTTPNPLTRLSRWSKELIRSSSSSSRMSLGSLVLMNSCSRGLIQKIDRVTSKLTFWLY